jgi:hypothetical protein
MGESKGPVGQRRQTINQLRNESTQCCRQVLQTHSTEQVMLQWSDKNVTSPPQACNSSLVIRKTPDKVKLNLQNTWLLFFPTVASHKTRKVVNSHILSAPTGTSWLRVTSFPRWDLCPEKKLWVKNKEISVKCVFWLRTTHQYLSTTTKCTVLCKTLIKRETEYGYI